MSYTENSIGFKIADNTAEGTKQPVIINQIMVRPINRQSVDIGHWRNANKAAESLIPRRVQLYDLYADITSTDGHIISVWGKRQDAVTLADWQFTDKDGNPVEEINQLIDCIGFENLLRGIIDSKAWGYSMMEPTFFKNCDEKNELSVYLIPRKHMRPETGIIAKEQTGNDGVNIREGIYASTVMEVGEANDLGLLLSAAQYAIYKRGDVSDWAEFIEIFGRGIIDATWDGFDSDQRDKLSEAIESMGGGGVILHPEGTKIEVQNNTGNANGQLQEKFFSAMNKEISKVLLGTTETTESSTNSGYAQSKTHQDADNQKHETDVNFVRRILNSRFIKILKAAGFDTKGGSFTIKSKSELKLKEAFEIHFKMATKMGIPVDHDFFYEQYGMPKPKDYDKQVKALLEAKNAEKLEKEEDKDAHTPPVSAKEKGKKSDAASSEKVSLSAVDKLFRGMASFFGFAPAAVTGAETVSLTASICCGDHLIALSLPESDFDNDALIKRFYDAEGKLNFDTALFHYIAGTLTTGLKQGLDSKNVNLMDIGFEYGAYNAARQTSYEQNLFRFSAAKTLAEAQELNRLFRQFPSWDLFYLNAKLKVDIFNKDWLRTEFDACVKIGESAADFERMTANIDIFPYWEYKTVEDSHVRPEHQLLHGVVLPATDPLWKKIFPPNGWKCRCWVASRMKHEIAGVDFDAMRERVNTYFETEAFQKSKAAGWDINRADGNEVFTANQMYIQSLEGQAGKVLNDLQPTDYALKPYNEAKQMAKVALPVFDKTSADFYNVQESFDGEKAIRDYNNRPMRLDRRSFDSGQDARYVSAMKEAAEKPDEVWINGSGGKGSLEDLVYIKYYTDRTMIVVGKIEAGKTTKIFDWFPVTDPMAVEAYRKGLLILSGGRL